MLRPLTILLYKKSCLGKHYLGTILMLVWIQELQGISKRKKIGQETELVIIPTSADDLTVIV